MKQKNRSLQDRLFKVGHPSALSYPSHQSEFTLSDPFLEIQTFGGQRSISSNRRKFSFLRRSFCGRVLNSLDSLRGRLQKT